MEHASCKRLCEPTWYLSSPSRPFLLAQGDQDLIREFQLCLHGPGGDQLAVVDGVEVEEVRVEGGDGHVSAISAEHGDLGLRFTQIIHWHQVIKHSQLRQVDAAVITMQKYPLS